MGKRVIVKELLLGTLSSTLVSLDNNPLFGDTSKVYGQNQVAKVQYLPFNKVARELEYAYLPF
jgi:hypothetical protein